MTSSDHQPQALEVGRGEVTIDPREQFIARFTARLVELAGPTDDDGMNYARQAAEAAWDEPEQREEGPEACAEADYSYWED